MFNTFNNKIARIWRQHHILIARTLEGDFSPRSIDRLYGDYYILYFANASSYVVHTVTVV